METTAERIKKKKFVSFYTKGEEIFNAVSHIAGGAFSLAAWICLALLSTGAKEALAVSAFGFGATVLYTMSALYHFLPVGRAKAVFRIFDHCTIFLLIAGTYTPFAVIALGGTDAGLAILIAEWVLCAAGIAMNAVAMEKKAVKIISMILYVVTGWMILAAFPLLLSRISAPAFALLLAGGIAYSAGIVFYALGKKVKYFHSVWHLFDVAGTVLQFVSILLLLRNF